MALYLTDNTPLAPTEHELGLLQKYVQGILTIDELVELFEGNMEEAKDNSAGNPVAAEPPSV